MVFDIHMSDTILNTSKSSVDWKSLSPQTWQDSVCISFQLFFLIGAINSAREVYNYLKVGAKDKKLLEIPKEHLIVVIM